MLRKNQKIRGKEMFAKLNKLRSDHEKALLKLEEAKRKVEEISAKVKEAELSEVVSIAEQYRLTPEKLYEMVKAKETNEVIKDVVTNKAYSPAVTATTKKEEEEDLVDEDL